MEILLWSGVVVTLLGIGGLLLSAILVGRARKEFGDDDNAMRARIQKLLPMNMGGLFVAVFGLMMVMIGLALS
ncbi:MAG: hypothetical protein CSA70_01010 [Rhodobacterales bacterium]|nr:MAG: hypothetical protein CSA70_01010 [Rhodobacterales bacterium]